MKTPILISWIMAAGLATGGTMLCAQDTATKAPSATSKKSAPTGVGNAAGAPASSAGSASTADRTELLRSMDLDHDGKVSPEEFAKYQASHGGTGLTPKATATPAPKQPEKRNGDTGQSNTLYNTAPDTGRSGSEAGRPQR